VAEFALELHLSMFQSFSKVRLGRVKGSVRGLLRGRWGIKGKPRGPKDGPKRPQDLAKTLQDAWIFSPEAITLLLDALVVIMSENYIRSSAICPILDKCIYVLCVNLLMFSSAHTGTWGSGSLPGGVPAQRTPLTSSPTTPFRC